MDKSWTKISSIKKTKMAIIYGKKINNNNNL